MQRFAQLSYEFDNEIRKIHEISINIDSKVHRQSVYNFFLPSGDSHIPTLSISDFFAQENRSVYKLIIDHPKTHTLFNKEERRKLKTYVIHLSSKEYLDLQTLPTWKQDWLTDSDYKSYLNRISVLLNTTFRERIPNAVRESMEQSLPTAKVDPVFLYLCLKEPWKPRRNYLSDLFDIPLGENVGVHERMSMLLRLQATARFPEDVDQQEIESVTLMEVILSERFEAEDYDGLNPVSPLQVAFHVVLYSDGTLDLVKVTNIDSQQRVYILQTLQLSEHFNITLALDTPANLGDPTLELAIETGEGTTRGLRHLEKLPGYGLFIQDIVYGSETRSKLNKKRDWRRDLGVTIEDVHYKLMDEGVRMDWRANLYIRNCWETARRLSRSREP